METRARAPFWNMIRTYPRVLLLSSGGMALAYVLLLLDTETVTDTDGDGDAGFLCVSPLAAAGSLVSATATNTTPDGTFEGDTSEFSLNETVDADT